MGVEDLAFVPTFQHMYGAQLLASAINVFLYGTALILVLQYFRSHSKDDPITIRATIGALILSSTIETFCSVAQTYDAFILKFGRQELFNEIVPAVCLEFLFVYVTAFIAQLFFASRIWKVGYHLGFRFIWFVLPVAILAVLQLGAGIAQVTLMFQSKLYTTLDQKTPLLLKVTTMQGVSAAICDIWITVTLCWVFHLHRSGIQRTNTVVDKLIVYAIHRGAATSVCALLNVLLYSLASGTFYLFVLIFLTIFSRLIPLLATTHLYVISAVTVLTTREGLRQEIDKSIHLTDLMISHESEITSPAASRNQSEQDPHYRLGKVKERV